MASPRVRVAVQALSIATSLVASGGIMTLSLFDVPILQSQPASRSLPSIRWLFSRGSHIFPQAAVLSSAGFMYLAYAALPASRQGLLRTLSQGSSFSGTVVGYLLAAALSGSIGPFTAFVMIPTNFQLIEKNAQMGGARSVKSAGQAGVGVQKSAEDSVNGYGEASQFTDLSGPQQKTLKDSSKTEDEQARELLEKFKWLNGCRALLLASGGMVGLICALL